MNTVFSLFFFVPVSFFGSAFLPSGVLPVISASGIAALIVGVLLGLFRRDANLFWVLASVLLSHGFVIVAGIFRGQFVDGAEWVIYSFLFIQIVLAIALIWRAARSRIAASLLAWFAISYAYSAALFAALAVSNAVI